MTVAAWLSEELEAYTSASRAEHDFPPTTFFHSWDLQAIRSSTLFQTVSGMPKGGALHLHR